jgi:hypothetical protein
MESWSRQTVSVFPLSVQVDNLHTQSKAVVETIWREDTVRVAVKAAAAAAATLQP